MRHIDLKMEEALPEIGKCKIYYKNYEENTKNLLLIYLKSNLQQGLNNINN